MITQTYSRIISTELRKIIFLFKKFKLIKISSVNNWVFGLLIEIILSYKLFYTFFFLSLLSVTELKSKINTTQLI